MKHISKIKSNPIVQLSFELLSYKLITSLIKDKDRAVFVAIHSIDTLSLILNFKSDFNFKKTITRNMLHSAIHDIHSVIHDVPSSKGNPIVVCCRLFHHLLTVYLSLVFPDTKFLRLFISLLESVNMLSAGIFFNNHFNKGNYIYDVNEFLITTRFYSQLLFRMLLLVYMIVYFKRKENISPEIKLFGVIITLIGFQEIAYCYSTYRDLITVSLSPDFH